MSLGTKSHTAGNTTRYIIDYSDWLEEGESLSAAPPPAIVLDPAFTATVKDVVIGTVTITASNHLVFLLTATVINEPFTLDVQIHNSRGEVKNDTLSFVVIAP